MSDGSDAIIPENVPYTIATDIFVVEKPEIVHLMVCERDAKSGTALVRHIVMMTPENFWRCLKDKFDAFGQR